MLLIGRNSGGSPGKKSRDLLAPAQVISKTNKIIADIIDVDLRILAKIKKFVVDSGGKRIRPLFTYYLGKSYDLESNELLRLGALLEIVHAASLLHDDVVDGATERRSKPTGGVLFGNKQVILGGDHLLATGLSYLNRLQNRNYMTIFTHAIRALARAELLQMQHHFDLKTSAKVHLSIIDGKTGVLFRSAGALVALLRGEAKYQDSGIAHLGLEFGRFFQERDDYLDYFDANRLKKKGFQDFQNGIVTQPLIRLLKVANRADRQTLERSWRETRNTGKVSNAAQIAAMLEKYAIRAALDKDLSQKRENIVRGLANLPEGDAQRIISGEFQKVLAVREA